jgi:hypothetical protein
MATSISFDSCTDEQILPVLRELVRALDHVLDQRYAELTVGAIQIIQDDVDMVVVRIRNIHGNLVSARKEILVSLRQARAFLSSAMDMIDPGRRQTRFFREIEHARACLEEAHSYF